MAEDKKQENTAEKATEKQALPELKPGMTVKVHQQITEQGPKGEKKRIQVFEGMVIAIKRSKEAGASITVRKLSSGIGVEKIFPLNSPNVVKIEPVKQAKVRQGKLYYLRTNKKKLRETKIETK